VDETDVTPSLTSDGDAEQGPDEPSPPTPPQVTVVVVQRPDEAEEALPRSPPRSHPEEVTRVPRPPTPPRRSRETSAQTKFDERPSLSPLPALTPRKTWPPSRTAAHALIAEESNDDEDDEEDEMTYLRVQSLTHLRPLRLLLLAHDESKNRNDDGDKYSQQTRSRGNAWTVRVRSYRHPHVL